MHLWADAEACPQGITALRCRAAARRQIALMLVAPQPRRTPPSPWITAPRGPAGVDGADHAIVRRVRAGDLGVTADLPLAARVVAQGAQALNPRGPLYTRAHTHDHLTLRHVLDERRQRGVDTGGPAPFRPRDRPDGAGGHRVSATHRPQQARTDGGQPPVRPHEPCGGGEP
jgi:uncharacterized protein YaiI (UPF0178 family)